MWRKKSNLNLTTSSVPYNYLTVIQVLLFSGSVQIRCVIFLEECLARNVFLMFWEVQHVRTGTYRHVKSKLVNLKRGTKYFRSHMGNRCIWFGVSSANSLLVWLYWVIFFHKWYHIWKVFSIKSCSAARCSLLRTSITWKIYLLPQLKRTNTSVVYFKLPRRRVTYLNLYWVLGGMQWADLWRWLVPYLSLTFKQSGAVSPPAFVQQPIPFNVKSEFCIFYQHNHNRDALSLPNTLRMFNFTVNTRPQTQFFSIMQ